MFDFQQKRKLRIILESRFTWAVLLVLAGFMAMSAFGRYQIAHEASLKREETEKEKIRLEGRKKDLTEEVKYLSNDRGIEAEMRRQFDVVKEGEQIVVIVEDDSKKTGDTGSSENATTSVNEEKTPWYRFW